MKKEIKEEVVKKEAIKPMTYEVIYKDGKNYEKITLPNGKVIEREQ